MKSLFLIAIFVAGCAAKPNVLLQKRIHHERIVNGVDAKEGQFPYQVSIQLEGSHICGGSILNERWILSAAHCDVAYGRQVYKVAAGILNLKQPESTYQKQEVKNVFIHPKYNGGVSINDIALFELKEPFTLIKGKVEAIKLSAEENVRGKSVLSGWGFTNYWYPVHLQTAELDLLPFHDCANAFVDLIGHSEPLEEGSNICTAAPHGNAGACFGDSGGPLVQNGVQIGIVSWGLSPCGGINAPSVYTRVSHFNNFVQNYVKLD